MSASPQEVKSVDSINRFIAHITSNDTAAIQQIQNVVLREMQNHALDHGFKQIMPLLLSPITDPLNHKVYPAEIQYEQRKFKLTASMIFHKQLALMSPQLEKIFIVSPNIRLELANVKSSNNHLLEFSQFDMELRGVTMDVVMDYIEALLKHTFNTVKIQCKAQLAILGRELPDWKSPFERVSTLDSKKGEDELCAEITNTSTAPVFVTSFKREFYDRENPNRLGTYCNFDLIYPDGFGEALSGAEREYRYDDIVRRMTELNMDLIPFENYLALAKRGLIPRTAGAGIGVQRLIKFISGRRNIADVCLFDRSISSNFTF